MNEFSFIQFATTINDCEIPLPIKLMSDVAFYTDKDSYSIWAFNNSRTSSINIGGDVISLGDGLIYIKLIGEIPYLNECFTINLINEAGTIINISNPLFYSENSDYSLFEYYCHEPKFGFKYGVNGATYQNRIRLPLKIQKPQFPQQDEIYIDAMGVRRLLTSRVDKEYTLETDYLSVEMHEKIIVALSHNFVFINDEQLQRSGAYEIDYENELLSDCGEKLYKGTARMARNTTLLNLNC